jgi:hypothetical protein
VILEERLLRHLRRRCRGGAHLPLAGCHAHLVAHAVHVAGDQLQLRVRVRRAAGIGERYPAVQVECRVGGVQLGDVVGFPGEPAGEVGKLERLLAGARGFQLAHQRRPVAQAGRHAVVDDAPRQAGLDAIADTHYHPAVGCQHGGGLDRFRAGGRMRAYDAHLAADVLLQQLGGREQVEVEVLLEQGERSRV